MIVKVITLIIQGSTIVEVETDTREKLVARLQRTNPNGLVLPVSSNEEQILIITREHDPRNN